MQPIISAMVANSERMRLFLGFGRPSVGELLRMSWTIAVAMVATAPMIAATMVSERPMRYGNPSKLPTSVFLSIDAAARGLPGVRTGSHFGLRPRRAKAQDDPGS